MIDNINNSNNLINVDNSLQSQDIQGSQAVSKSSGKNPYADRQTNLIDESDISQEAVNLYKKEQEISQYTAYLSHITEEEANQQVAELMEKGIISISDEELAESMYKDIPLLNELFN